MGRKNKKVYICSPLRANTPEVQFLNMKRAEEKEIFTQYYLNDKFPKYDWKTFAPHAYLPKFLDDNNTEERCIGLQFGAKLLKVSDYIAVFPSRGISQGMASEIVWAAEFGLKLIVFGESEKNVVSEFLESKNITSDVINLYDFEGDNI